MLRKPVLALTRDRSKLAQYNKVCGDPGEWFDSPAFRDLGIRAASFDFFVDWTRERICDEVWIKRISDSRNIRVMDATGLKDLISQCDGADQSNDLYRFLQQHRFREKYMLFRDVPEEEWASGNEKVVELDLSKSQEGCISYFSAGEIQMKIKDLRRVPAPIGSAGLIYSTSSLEGYLSRQPYFWPGDVDALLFHKKNQAIAAVEFKKHTAKSRIRFEDQMLSNYLERDILKYKSLALLRDRFCTKLFVIYYPIPGEIRNIIVEEVKGAPDALYGSRRIRMDLPVRGQEASMRAFAETFMELALGDE